MRAVVKPGESGGQVAGEYRAESTSPSRQVLQAFSWLRVYTAFQAESMPAHTQVTLPISPCQKFLVKVKGNAMAIQRMDNVGIVVESLEEVIPFFIVRPQFTFLRRFSIALEVSFCLY